MLSPNSLITAPQQAGKAPICSGSTTCCATTSPLAFISAQEASCDSRTMVEKPVRNSEFCISCTMPESEAFTTSRSTASMCINKTPLSSLRRRGPIRRVLSAGARWSKTFAQLWLWVPACARTTASMTRFRASLVPRHDQILPLIHPRGLAGVDHRRAVELVENGGATQRQADVEFFALVDRAIDILAVHTHAAGLAQRVLEGRTGRLELRHRNRRHAAQAAHAIGDDLDRLLWRAVAEHG